MLIAIWISFRRKFFAPAKFGTSLLTFKEGSTLGWCSHFPITIPFCVDKKNYISLPSFSISECYFIITTADGCFFFVFNFVLLTFIPFSLLILNYIACWNIIIIIYKKEKDEKNKSVVRSWSLFLCFGCHRILYILLELSVPKFPILPLTLSFFDIWCFYALTLLIWDMVANI